MTTSRSSFTTWPWVALWALAGGQLGALAGPRAQAALTLFVAALGGLWCWRAGLTAGAEAPLGELAPPGAGGGPGGGELEAAAGGEPEAAAGGARVKPWLLDTSALIDGRVVALCERGLAAEVILPRCVLEELHKLADRSSKARRGRGRRGLEQAARLREVGVVVRGDDAVVPEDGVDVALLEMAARHGARLVSVDGPLLARAEAAGCAVLPLHEMARELQNPAIPGDRIELQLIKRGENKGQAVGYLEDGTMVVVDGGADRVGDLVGAVIGSSIKTRNGPLIFARLAKEEDA